MIVIADLALLASNPGIALIAAALLVPWLPPALARVYAPAAALAALTYAVGLTNGSHIALSAAGLDLQILRVDPSARLFAAVFLTIAFLGSVYAWGENGRIGRTAGLVLAGAATAAVYCGDLLTFMMLSGTATIASILLVWSGGGERALRAGLRYAVVQVAAVVLLLAGVVMYAHATGSIALDRLPAGTAGVGLILAALAIQAAFPLVHSWLKDAYPEASPAGTVMLSVFTTNLAVYALIRAYPGTEALIWVGAAMVVLPLLAAALEDDLRRALAWALNSQLGAIVMAVGIGSNAALDAALALAVTHTLAVALQFMALGAVLERTGTVRASQLGGLRRTMPLTAAFYLIGAAATGLPLFVGFAALPLVLEAAAGIGGIPYLALLVGVAGGFMISLARIPYRTFFGSGGVTRVAEAPAAMLAAMAGMAVLCVVPGIWPSLLHDALPNAQPVAVYAARSFGTVVALAAAGVVAFAALTRFGLYPADRRNDVPDVEWIYRRLLPGILIGLGRGIDATWNRLTAGCLDLLAAGIPVVASVFGPSGVMGRMTRVGNGVAWLTALLLVILVVGYSAD